MLFVYAMSHKNRKAISRENEKIKIKEVKTQTHRLTDRMGNGGQGIGEEKREEFFAHRRINS